MKFDLSQEPKIGILPQEDLMFFYYNVGTDVLQGWGTAYDWESISKEFEGRLEFHICYSYEEIPTTTPNNTIYFTVDPSPDRDNGNVAAAFFRHLRNAFSHYRIVRRNDNFSISDKNGKIFTMNGIVDCELLKDFCYRFFDVQKEILERIREIESDTQQLTLGL